MGLLSRPRWQQIYTAERFEELAARNSLLIDAALDLHDSHSLGEPSWHRIPADTDTNPPEWVCLRFSRGTLMRDILFGIRQEHVADTLRVQGMHLQAQQPDNGMMPLEDLRATAHRLSAVQSPADARSINGHTRPLPLPIQLCPLALEGTRYGRLIPLPGEQTLVEQRIRSCEFSIAALEQMIGVTLSHQVATPTS